MARLRRLVPCSFFSLLLALQPSRSAPDSAGFYTAGAQADRVEELPGLGKVDQFGLFSGYVTVSEEDGRALFYAFAEAQQQPETAPLVLWQNGGPGCSSIGGGFLSELGPFYPEQGGQGLVRNRYPWNQVASIVFLESPAEVGFSYSNITTDVRTGDKRTAEDGLAFLRGFLDRFPQYRGRPLWLAGESYAGHYVPNLALAILEATGSTNSSSAGAPQGSDINLAGIFLGNPWTDAKIDNTGVVNFWYSHGLVSTQTAKAVLQTCNLTNIGPLQNELHIEENQPAARSPAPAPMPDDDALQERCNAALDASTYEVGNINIYDIYKDVCVGNASSKVAAAAGRLARAEAGAGAGAAPVRLGRASLALVVAQRQSASMEAAQPLPPIPEYDPCIDDEVAAYLNRPDVQEALHANTSSHKVLDRPWADCNDAVSKGYSQDDLYSSELPVWQRILGQGLSVAVYSGDVDTVCSFIGTRGWVEGLGLPRRQGWRPWYSATGQVGGWLENYEGLTYATVRDAGHMVPYTQPERAFFLFSKFLAASQRGVELFPS